MELFIVSPRTPQQNLSDGEIRTVVEAARTYMHSRNDLPKALWAELVNAATHVLNRTGHSTAPEKSSYELCFRKLPYIKHLRIVGSDCYAHIPKANRKKVDTKAIQGILIGYDPDGFRILCSQKKSLSRSRDVFNEKLLYSVDEDEVVENKVDNDEHGLIWDSDEAMNTEEEKEGNV
ncbi:hypothetical protein ILUMI_21378 [Ignelater luminosus]|uniref:Retroviral polymerase SH3-like domain-containing protein n=1 Tax=Ignelater luminosus TaxID=2038154 RepID=A0A8K0CGH6_IGNLU|nr:hypothetical protein ILUMI_21378 [Ignelater luminosus]